MGFPPVLSLSWTDFAAPRSWCPWAPNDGRKAAGRALRGIHLKVLAIVFAPASRLPLPFAGVVEARQGQLFMRIDKCLCVCAVALALQGCAAAGVTLATAGAGVGMG